MLASSRLASRPCEVAFGRQCDGAPSPGSQVNAFAPAAATERPRLACLSPLVCAPYDSFALRAVTAASAIAWPGLSDSSSGPDRADARPRRCFAQRPRLGSGGPLGGSGSEALRASTTAPLIGRGRLPQPHRLRKQHGYGARRNPRRVDSRTAGTMQQSATRDETTPSRSLQQRFLVEALFWSVRSP